MDEAALVPDATRDGILETLAKIKARDPAIYAKDSRFYSSEEEQDEEEEDKGGGKALARGGRRGRRER